MEILIVLVVGIRLFGVHTTSGVGLRVQTKATRRGGREPCGATVACEMALAEDLDKLVLTMALHRACVADTGRGEVLFWAFWWGVAGKAGEDILAKRTEGLCTVVNAVWEGFTRICFKLRLLANETK